jgi:hypothetical protein
MSDYAFHQNIVNSARRRSGVGAVINYVPGANFQPGTGPGHNAKGIPQPYPVGVAERGIPVDPDSVDLGWNEPGGYSRDDDPGYSGSAPTQQGGGQSSNSSGSDLVSGGDSGGGGGGSSGGDTEEMRRRTLPGTIIKPAPGHNVTGVPQPYPQGVAGLGRCVRCGNRL